MTLDVAFGSTSLTPSGNAKLDGQTSMGIGLTGGLGNNFALQYKNNNFKSDYAVGGNPALKAQEFNLLYKLTDGVSAFAGATYANFAGNSNTSGAQFGLTGTVKVADNTHLYGILATGNNINSYEIGAGYTIAKNTELNISYRDAKYKGLDFGAGNSGDVTAKGLSYGISYKF